MHLKALLVTSSMLALLTGCATGPSLSDPKSKVPALQETMGRIYFYRTGIIGSAYQPEISLNGKAVGKAVPRGVFLKDVEPGNYEVTTSMTKKTVNFPLTAGQIQYIRLTYSFGFEVVPELIDNSTGQREAQDLSYIAAP